MRTLLLTVGFTFISVTWLAAQEPTPGNSSRPDPVKQAGGQAGQADQNTGRAGINQTPATPGQNRRQSATEAGQTQTQTRTQIQGQTRIGQDTASSSGQLDSLILTCVRGSNRNEIEISKLAVQKATDPEVKAFAQMMVKDHSGFMAKLDRLNQTIPVSRQTGTTTETRESTSTGTQTDAQNRRDADRDRNANPDSATSNTRTSSDGDARSKTSDARREDNRPAGNPSASTDAQDANRTNRARANQRTTTGQAGVTGQAEVRTGTTTAVERQTAAHGGGIVAQLIQIDQELADRCLASAQRELNEKQGKDFDMAYVGMQIAAHMKMVDTLSVYSRHASGELQQALNEGLETSQQHLEHAKQLVKQVEGSGNSNANANPNASADSENRNANPAATPRRNQKSSDR